MSNIIRIGQDTFVEDEIHDHASAIKGARELLYAVNTASFDGIWRRTGAQVNRTTWPTPRMQLNGGRHDVMVAIDDEVPVDEVRLVADSAP